MSLSKTWIGSKVARENYHDSMAAKYGIQSAEEDKNCKIAAAFWVLGICGCCGCHRCYLENYCTGTAWCMTLGCLGICQIYDLFCLKYLTDRSNSAGSGGDWDGGY